MNSGAQPPFSTIADETIKAFLVTLRSQVAPILNINLFPHFTDHSVSHSDRLIELVDQLLTPAAISNKLTDHELCILYSACYLHDIGMQFERPYELDLGDSFPLQENWAQLCIEDQRELIRKYHSHISAQLVLQSASGTQSPLGMQITRERGAEYMASLCEAHTLEAGADRYRELTREAENVRLSLLSALLRLADILDESCQRALNRKILALDIPTESLVHWWRHHYTEDITFDASNRVIVINFDFPEAERDEYKDVVPRLQMPWIEREFEAHREILNRFNLTWSLRSEVLEKAYHVVERMPKDIFLEMLKELHAQKKREDDERRKHSMQALVEAQHFVEREIASIQKLRNSLPRTQYIMQLWEIARTMRDLGAGNSAWSLLINEYLQASALLPVSSQIEIGIWILRAMLEGKCPRVAASLCMRLDEVFSSDDIDRLTVEECVVLKTRMLIAIYQLDEARQFLENNPIPHGTSTTVESARVELLESYFLQGRFDEIEESTARGENA